LEFSNKQFIASIVIISILTSVVFGFFAGSVAYEMAKNGKFSLSGSSPAETQVSANSGACCQEQSVINAVKDVSPAVVSVIATKDLPVIEQQMQDVNPFGDLFPGFSFQVPQYTQKGTQEKEVGGGTGFIISSDGLILTNKHVVSIEGAQYTVLTNDEQKYPATVLATDPVQDVAILKIDKTGLPTVKLGDSDAIQIGQTAIAIGNALGEFRNTVSVGVVSGLKRSITAGGIAGGGEEALEDVIQTDVAINPGNSGGPLLNSSGEVVGVNVAMASGAENIGFALPVNIIKRDIDQVIKTGKISYPFLGIRYTIITPALKDEQKLPVDYGALIVKGTGDNEPAIVAGSPAEKAGLKEGDIILEAGGKKIDKDNTLDKIIQGHNIGDALSVKILRDGKEMNLNVALGER
jgi:S1-C subfamily serine protease